MELYVLNSVYLDGNGAELATIGDVGVVILVTDGDFILAVAVVVVVVTLPVGVKANFCGRSMTVVFVLGELKSNDNRDL